MSYLIPTCCFSYRCITDSAAAGAAFLLILMPCPSLAQDGADHTHHHSHQSHIEHSHEKPSGTRISVLKSKADIEAAYNSQSAAERLRAVDAAAELAEAERASALPLVVRALGDNEASVRTAAARAFRYLRVGTDAARSALVAALADKDLGVVKESTISLGSLLHDSKTGIPELAALLEHADADVRFRAADALDGIGEPASRERAVCLLAESLTDKITLERDERHLHPKAYLPAARLDEKGNRKPAELSRMLGRCGRPEAIRAELIEALKHQNQLIRAIAGKVIAWWKTAAPPELLGPLLAQIKKEELPAVRGYLIKALAARPFVGDEVFAVLSSQAGSPAAADRRAVYAVLGVMPANNALPILMKGVADTDAAARIAAIDALAAHGVNAADSVPVLAARLHKQEASVRELEAVLAALQRIGSEPAIRALKEYNERHVAGGRSGGAD